MLNGLGSRFGTVVAAVIMIGGGEMLRDLQEYRMLVFGIVLVVMMALRLHGLVSNCRA